MSLAARCATCGTVFRVVQDQLRVSEGWVRCGRCNEVFNAAEVLFDIDTGSPRELDLADPEANAPQHFEPPQVRRAPVAVPPPPPPAPAPPVVAPPPPEPPAPAPAVPDDDAWAATVQGSLQDATLNLPGGAVEPELGHTPAWDQPTVQAEPDFGTPAPLPPSPTDHDEPLLKSPSLADDPEVSFSAPALAAADLLRPAPDAPLAQPPAEPTFMRQANHQAFWRRPAVRTGMVAASAVLGALLVAQLAIVWRDTLAAHVPATEPALQALCRVTGCTVQPLRRLDSITVASSALNRVEASPLYRLQLVLQNRADTPVMMPTLDLQLQDGQGHPVIRRALQAQDLGLNLTVLQPGQELPIKVVLSTGNLRVDGYTLDLFYP